MKISLELLNQYYDFTELMQYPGFLELLEHGSFYPRFMDHFLIMEPHIFHSSTYKKMVTSVHVYTREMSSFSLHPWFEDPSRRLRILLGEEKNPCEQHFNLIRDYFAIETWAMMVDPILNAAERFHSKLRAYYIAQRLPDNVSSTDLRTLRDTSTYEFYIVGKQERFALLYCAEQKTIEDVQSYRREFNEVIEHTFCAPHN